MKHRSLAFFMVVLCACTTAPGNQLSCGDAGPNTYYFPTGAFAERYDPNRAPLDNGYDREAELRGWHCETLDYLGAPSLSCGAPPADETYRLVWLRSFHVPVVIQVSRTANTHTIDLILPNERQQDGKPILRQRRALSPAGWSRITTGLEKIDFWNLMSNDEPAGVFGIPGADEIVVVTSRKDGADWIIEGRAERYHVIKRWSEDHDVIAVGRIFIALAQLQIPEDDIY